MITISAKVQNSQNKNHIVLKTLDKEHSITIPSKSNGFGSSVNGGETLFLALAICYCNDLYREAEKKSINVTEGKNNHKATTNNATKIQIK